MIEMCPGFQSFAGCGTIVSSSPKLRLNAICDSSSNSWSRKTRIWCSLNASQIARKSSRGTGTVRSMPVTSATKSGCRRLMASRVLSAAMASSGLDAPPVMFPGARLAQVWSEAYSQPGLSVEAVESGRLEGQLDRPAGLRQRHRGHARHEVASAEAQVEENFVADGLHVFQTGRNGRCRAAAIANATDGDGAHVFRAQPDDDLPPRIVPHERVGVGQAADRQGRSVTHGVTASITTEPHLAV